MKVTETDAKIESVMRQLGLEFVDATQDMIGEIDGLLDRMRRDERGDAAFMELRRIIHSIKGQGGTFGFPLITQVAHMLEDYIETLTELNTRAIDDIQAFIDKISSILDSPTQPTGLAAETLLETLPNTRAPEFSNQIVKDLRALVVMPKGIQRKIIGQELVSCGFRLNFASTALDGLETALAFPPDIVFASMEIQGFTGGELASVFHEIQSLKGAKFIVLTSYDMDDSRLKRLPIETGIIRKDADFAEQLVDCLMGWGIFGKSSSSIM